MNIRSKYFHKFRLRKKKHSHSSTNDQSFLPLFADHSNVSDNFSLLPKDVRIISYIVQLKRFHNSNDIHTNDQIVSIDLMNNLKKNNMIE